MAVGRFPIPIACVATALALAVLSGCSERRTEVTGKVTYNGAPLNRAGGEIVFVSKSGVQVAAPIDADGTYRAKGVVVGENRVAVYYVNRPAKTGRLLPKKGDTEPPAPVASQFVTPQSYASVDTSNLAFNVVAPAVYNPELKGPEIP
jgi:hypothetical protein